MTLHRAGTKPESKKFRSTHRAARPGGADGRRAGRDQRPNPDQTRADLARRPPSGIGERALPTMEKARNPRAFSIKVAAERYCNNEHTEFEPVRPWARNLPKENSNAKYFRPDDRPRNERPLSALHTRRTGRLFRGVHRGGLTPPWRVVREIGGRSLGRGDRPGYRQYAEQYRGRSKKSGNELTHEVFPSC